MEKRGESWRAFTVGAFENLKGEKEEWSPMKGFGKTCNLAKGFPVLKIGFKDFITIIKREWSTLF